MATPPATNTFKRNYRNIPPTPDSIWRNPLHFIAFGFGVGTIPFAPGTFGTLIAIPFYLTMRPLSNLTYLVITLIVIAASMWICDKASQDVGVQDHQGMCLDEVVGFLVTMFHAPHNWPWIGGGFILFRLFDIWKPWPINYVDAHVHGGIGMILDDVLAGVFSCIVLQILALIF